VSKKKNGLLRQGSTYGKTGGQVGWTLKQHQNEVIIGRAESKGRGGKIGGQNLPVKGISGNFSAKRPSTMERKEGDDRSRFGNMYAGETNNALHRLRGGEPQVQRGEKGAV